MSVAAIVAALDAVPDLNAESPSRVNPMERDSYPWATVYPHSDDVTEDTSISSGQIVTRSYMVLLTCDGADQLESARAAVVTRLNTLKPAGCIRPLVYTDGKLESINGALLQYAAYFDTEVCYG